MLFRRVKKKQILKQKNIYIYNEIITLNYDNSRRIIQNIIFHFLCKAYKITKHRRLLTLEPTERFEKSLSTNLTNKDSGDRWES